MKETRDAVYDALIRNDITVVKLSGSNMSVTGIYRMGPGFFLLT